MNTINTQPNSPKKSFSRDFLIPLSIFSTLSLSSIFNNAKATEKCRNDLCDLLKIKPKIVQANLKSDLQKDVLNIMEYFGIESDIEWLEGKDIIDVIKEYIDKDKVAEEYLKHNFFINWKPITSEELNYSFKKIEEDKYQIKYTHKFEWIPNYAEDIEIEVTADIVVLYENNNIYIKFAELKLWDSALEDNWDFAIGDVVYDFDINEKNNKDNKKAGDNKSIEINSKANLYKTLDMIRNRIKGYKFSLLWQLETIKEFENTQLIKLNDLSLWEEVMQEWEFYYREMFLAEKWKYRPIAKIYFDKYGKLEQNKTREELKKEHIILWTKIVFNESVKDNKISVSISEESKEQLKNKVKDHRTQLMNIINNAKVGPDTELPWLNKTYTERPWSTQKEWSFDTKLMSLELIDDTYVLQRWNENQAVYFGIKSSDWNKDKIYLKNKNNQEVEYFFITINNNYYKFTLENDELIIYKIKKERINIENNLPVFSWNKTLINILNAKDINTYYNTNSKNLEYWTNDWKWITSIPCEKTEKGEYKLEKTSTDISTEDLYNYPKFKQIINEIKTIQKKLNILDIDISNSFEILLIKKWIELNKQNLIKITDLKWINHYCTIKQNRDWIQIDLNEKLYKDVEKTLNKLKSRLEIVQKLNNTKLQWVNKWKQEDFTKFVWWGWWIWTRFISQSNIINFISQSTNEVELNILRWEWQTTTVIYEVSSKYFKVKLGGKQIINISWQNYKVKIDDDFHILLYPIKLK